MTATPSSRFRRTTLLAVIIAFASSVFAPLAKTQAQPVIEASGCSQEARTVMNAPMNLCVNPFPGVCNRSPQLFAMCEATRDNNIKLASELFQVRVLANRMMDSTTLDTSSGSREFKILKKLVDHVCEQNKCGGIKFSGYPSLVKENSRGLLFFLFIASARSVHEQASLNSLDLSYLLRLRQMEQAVNDFGSSSHAQLALR